MSIKEHGMYSSTYDAALMKAGHQIERLRQRRAELETQRAADLQRITELERHLDQTRHALENNMKSECEIRAEERERCALRLEQYCLDHVHKGELGSMRHVTIIACIKAIRALED